MRASTPSPESLLPDRDAATATQRERVAVRPVFRCGSAGGDGAGRGLLRRQVVGGKIVGGGGRRGSHLAVTQSCYGRLKHLDD